MGNYRFKLSDMIPNAWFYKLKDMGTKAKSTHPTTHNSSSKKPNKKKPPSPSSPARHTYYYFNPDHLNSPLNRKATLTHFPEPPRKSSKKKRKPPKLSSSSSSSTSSSKLVSASVSAGCSCRATFDSVWKPEALPELLPLSPPSPPSRPPVAAEQHLDNVHSWSSSCSCRVTSSSTTTDIAIDVADRGSLKPRTGKFDDGSDSAPSSNCKKSFYSEFKGRLDSVLMDEYDDGFNSVAKVELPPIMTKPAKFNDLILGLKRKEEEPISRFNRSTKMEGKVLHSYHHSHLSRGSLSVKVVKEQEKSTSPARRSTSSHGLRIRANSPRLASKKIQAYTRRSLPAAARRKSVSESFAVVKSSFDPQRDFRDSMVEMIVENNLRASKDLEDLLACYLSLNSNEYHDVIVKVFEQIWLGLTDIRL